MDLAAEQALLLNTTYEPLRVVSWKRAVRMLFQEKVEVVEEYDREVRSVSLALRLPSVLRLLSYRRIKRSYHQVRFTRSNLLARDDYRCQYCDRRLALGELTYDHVIPVSRGGSKSWDNIVTSCIACNRRKGGHTPEEAGLRLLRNPKAPPGFPHKIRFFLSRNTTPESWKTYIFWHVDTKFA